MTPGLRKVATSLLALTLISACSKSAGPSIVGHWRAERVSVYSVQLPIGPEIVVSGSEILSPDTGASVPVKDIESKSDATTVDLPYGVGLTFFFDGPDRMYLKVPVIGRVYYRRVVERNQASASEGTERSDIPKSASPVAAAGASALVPSLAGEPHKPGDVALMSTKNIVSTSTEGISRPTGLVGKGSDTSEAEAGISQYKLALVAANEGHSDAAISYLNDAFKAGFRGFNLMNSAPEMNALRTDVRYQALVARYH